MPSTVGCTPSRSYVDLARSTSAAAETASPSAR